MRREIVFRAVKENEADLLKPIDPALRQAEGTYTVGVSTSPLAELETAADYLRASLIDSFVKGDKAGLKSVVVFRVIFVLAVVVGAVNELGDVLDFSDIMILSMAFPNIIGSMILAPKVLKKMEEYWGRYTSGKMATYDQQKT